MEDIFAKSLQLSVRAVPIVKMFQYLRCEQVFFSLPAETEGKG